MFGPNDKTVALVQFASSGSVPSLGINDGRQIHGYQLASEND